jgi:hypothetical protein
VAPVVIECPNCRKPYSLPAKVPPTFACRACGTVMDLSGLQGSPAPLDEVLATVACGACGAEAPADRPFCSRCGKPLAAGAPEEGALASRMLSASAGGRRDPSSNARAGVSGPGRVGESRAKNDLAEFARAVGIVRVIYIIAALLHGLSLIGIAMLPPSDIRSLLLLVIGLFVTFDVTGAIYVRRNPFAWSLVLALFSTLVVVAALLGGGIPILWIIVALLAWSAVAKASRAKRLLERYPELARSGKRGAPSRGRREERSASSRRRSRV